MSEKNAVRSITYFADGYDDLPRTSAATTWLPQVQVICNSSSCYMYLGMSMSMSM